MNSFIDRLSKLSPNQKRAFRKYLGGFLKFLPLRRNLTVLALAYGTGKRSLGYTPYYQEHFKAIRKKKLQILEIGIGGYKDPTSGGHSLRMWKAYFPKSIIYGLDIFDKAFLEESRIKTFRGSQNDPEFLRHVADEIGGIDIVIDDGSHINEHVITSFRTLFPYLRDDGIYVIEDLQTSYWSHFGGTTEDLHEPITSVSMLKTLVDGLNYQFNPDRSPLYSDENIVSVHFYPGIAFVFKGKNKREIPEFVLQEMETAKNTSRRNY